MNRERCPCCHRLYRRAVKALPTAAEVLRARSRRDRRTGCLIWTGGLDKKGYGRNGVGAYERIAHRLAWMTWKGPIPPGLHVLHRCDNRPCIEPEHLFLGTNQDNVADRQRKGRTLSGDRSPLAKLTEAQAREIILSREPTEVLAARLQVSLSTVRDIRSGRKWRPLHAKMEMELL